MPLMTDHDTSVDKVGYQEMHYKDQRWEEVTLSLQVLSISFKVPSEVLSEDQQVQVMSQV